MEDLTQDLVACDCYEDFPITSASRVPDISNQVQRSDDLWCTNGALCQRHVSQGSYACSFSVSVPPRHGWPPRSFGHSPRLSGLLPVFSHVSNVDQVSKQLCLITIVINVDIKVICKIGINECFAHIAQNIAETCQKYFQSFIANLQF